MSINILIVDDEQSVRHLLEKMLSCQAGYRCKTAAGAVEARQHLNREAFDLILSDIVMPGESGIDLMRFASEAYPDTGIIMVTAVETDQEVEFALEIEVYGYVLKPFSQSQVLIAVTNALRHRKLDIRKRLHKKNLEEIIKERTAENLATIRELKQVQEQLLSSEERFRDLIEGSVLGILIHRDHKPIYVNQMWAYFHGYMVEEILEMDSVVPLMSIQDQARMVEYKEARLRGEYVPSSYEYQGVRKDGSLVWLENKVRTVIWNGQPAIQTTIHDISRRKKSEEGLQESEERFRAMSDSAQDAIIMIDSTGKITVWNKSAERIFGFTATEALGRNLHQLIVPDHYHEAHQKGFPKFLASGEGPAIGKTLELTAHRKTGETFPVELSLSGVRINNEWNAIGIVRDITIRKKAEDKLKKAHRDVDQIISAITHILIEIGSDECVCRWNGSAEKAFGIQEADIVGKPLLNCGLSLNSDKLNKGISECRENQRAVRLDNIRFARTDGSDGILGVTLTPIISSDNESVAVLFMGFDQTERLHLENQLSQAQKLESIGQLAAGIAHEINTPTQYVGDNTRFLQDAFGDLQKVLIKHGELLESVKSGNPTETLIHDVESVLEEADLSYLNQEIPKAIEQALEGVERVAKIVSSMKEFSHPGSGEKTAHDINRALESTITVARNEWKYVAEMETDFDPDLPLVPCLPGELNQVFLNMIINAAHAISDTSGNGSNGNGIIRVQSRYCDDSAEIRISDTGSGIPENVRTKIFDPFFTTKEVGRGSGQGLAISHTVIVEKHGGSLDFETEEGKGTTFIIRLPLDTDSERMTQ